MRVKYNRVSTVNQTGQRFNIDTDHYDLCLLDKVSGSVAFKDRPKGKLLSQLIVQRKVKELVIEDFSRIGRNTGDVIANLIWFEDNEINVIVRNIGLQSRPNGVKNPIWNLISTVMTGIYELELENIRERTHAGRLMYVQKGGVLGRPVGKIESEKDFLQKSKSQQILKALNRGLSVREIGAISGSSTRTVMKVKKISQKYKSIQALS